jgi:hypothetical protein
MIAALATGLALELGLPHEEIERVRIASLLHDLGKLAVPAEILDKPTTLTDGEWQAIGEHPRIGQVILEQASSLREAIPVILHHHERFNGGGYPHGLKGNEIPLGARIVSVADSYHAMVHDRPYQDAKTHEEALNELRRHAGTQFDPEVVEIFCRIYADGVPADGLEEVYRLHERARGGLDGLPHDDDGADGGHPETDHHRVRPRSSARARRPRSVDFRQAAGGSVSSGSSSWRPPSRRSSVRRRPCSARRRPLPRAPWRRPLGRRRPASASASATTGTASSRRAR